MRNTKLIQRQTTYICMRVAVAHTHISAALYIILCIHIYIHICIYDIYAFKQPAHLCNAPHSNAAQYHLHHFLIHCPIKLAVVKCRTFATFKPCCSRQSDKTPIAPSTLYLSVLTHMHNTRNEYLRPQKSSHTTSTHAF